MFCGRKVFHDFLSDADRTYLLQMMDAVPLLSDLQAILHLSGGSIQATDGNSSVAEEPDFPLSQVLPAAKGHQDSRSQLEYREP